MMIHSQEYIPVTSKCWNSISVINMVDIKVGDRSEVRTKNIIPVTEEDLNDAEEAYARCHGGV